MNLVPDAAAPFNDKHLLPSGNQLMSVSTQASYFLGFAFFDFAA